MSNKIKYLPLLLMGAFSAKALYLGLNWESVVSITVLAAFYSFLEFKQMSTEATKITKELEELKAKVKENEGISNDLKNSVSALRTATGLKLQNRGF